MSSNNKMAVQLRSSSTPFLDVLGVDDAVIQKTFHHFRDQRDALKAKVLGVNDGIIEKTYHLRDQRDAMKEMQNLVGHRAKLEANYAMKMGDTAKKFGLHSYYPQTLARVATEISNTHLNVADLLKKYSEDVGQASMDLKDCIKEHERSLGEAATEVATATKRVKDVEKMVVTKQKDLDELMDKVAVENSTKDKKKHFFSKKLKKSNDHDDKMSRLKMNKEDSELALSSSMMELELVVEQSRGQQQTIFNNLEAEEKLRSKQIMQTFVDCLEREMELHDQWRQRRKTAVDELKSLNVDTDFFSEKVSAAGAATAAAMTALEAKAPEGKDLNGIDMTIDATLTFKTEEVAGKRPSLQTQIDEGFEESAGQMLSQGQSEDAPENKVSAKPADSAQSLQALTDSDDNTENKASRQLLMQQQMRDSAKPTESKDLNNAGIALLTSPTPLSTINDGSGGKLITSTSLLEGNDAIIEKTLHHFRDQRDAMKEMQNLVGHRAKLEANYAMQMGDTAKKFGLHSYYPQTLARVSTEISNTHLNVADLLKQNSEDMGQAATELKDCIKEHERSLGDAATELATATKCVKDAEKMAATKQKNLDELMDKVAAGNATKDKKKHFFSKKLKKSDDHDYKMSRLKMHKGDSELALSSSMMDLELVVERYRGQQQTIFNNLEAEDKLRSKQIMQTFVDCLEREMELQDQQRQQKQTVVNELKALNVDKDVFLKKVSVAGTAAAATVPAPAVKALEKKDLNGNDMTIDKTFTFKTEEVDRKRPLLKMKIDKGFEESAGQMLLQRQSGDATKNKASAKPAESALSLQALTDSDDALSTSPTPPSTINDDPNNYIEIKAFLFFILIFFFYFLFF